MSIERPNRLDEFVEVNALGACANCGQGESEHPARGCPHFVDPEALAEWMEPLLNSTTSNAAQGVAPKDLSLGGSDGTGKEPSDD